MGSRKRLGAAASACVAMAIFAGPAAALPIGIPTANPNSGTPPNRIVNGYQLVKTAVGSDPLENPSGPFSWVNSSVRVNGSHVVPSSALKCLSPSAPVGVSSVIRCAGSATSRLTRVM